MVLGQLTSVTGPGILPSILGNSHRPLPRQSTVCVRPTCLKFAPLCALYPGKTVFPLSDGPGLWKPYKLEQIRARPVATRSSKKAAARPSPTSTNNKPQWWWRTLSALPYLLPLHNIWTYADITFQLHHVLEPLGFLAAPFNDTMYLLPQWAMMALFMGAYFFVVRRKEWPHVLRFHVAMALLFDTGLQAVCTACTWIPGPAYRGAPMTYLWAAVAFSLFYTVVECMKCALAGMYPDVPFMSDTAYIHCDPQLLRT